MPLQTRPGAYKPSQGYMFQLFSKPRNDPKAKWKHYKYAKDAAHLKQLINEFNRTMAAKHVGDYMQFPEKYWSSNAKQQSKTTKLPSGFAPLEGGINSNTKQSGNLGSGTYK